MLVDSVSLKGGILVRKLGICACVLLLVVLPAIPKVYAAHASPATVEVDAGNCPGPGSGTGADPFCRLEDARQHSAAGDLLLVNSGSFDEAGDFSGRNLEAYAPVILRGKVGGAIESYDTFKLLGAEVSDLTIENYAAFEVTGGSVSGKLEFERYASVSISGVEFSGAGVKVSYDQNALSLDLAAVIAANTWNGTPQAVGTTIVLTPPPPPPPSLPDPPDDIFLRLSVEEGVSSVRIEDKEGWHWPRGPFGPGRHEIRFLHGSRFAPSAEADECFRDPVILLDGDEEGGEVSMRRDREADVRAERRKIPVTVVHAGKGTGTTDPPPGIHEVLCGESFHISAESGPLSALAGIRNGNELFTRASEHEEESVKAPLLLRVLFERTAFRVSVRGGAGGRVLQEGEHVVPAGRDLLLSAFPDDARGSCRWRGPVRHPQRCMTFLTALGDALAEAAFLSPSPLPENPETALSFRTAGPGKGLVIVMPRVLWRDRISFAAISAPGSRFDRWVVNGNDRNGWEESIPVMSVPNDGRRWDVIAVFE